ncbi:MAG TPA: response regulator transcription factor [Dehalococcoidia bacterium]|jgi:DNA-binding response OmpR family regulator|nr:response regulator transcription factor [Dehalococcoidia bacterium]
MSILVVEDDTDLTDVLAYMLRREGHEVHVAHDGQSALETWEESNPNLILLDVDIPRVNGWEVCEQVRRNSPTPIIMLTAYHGDENIMRGLELGADDYVTKPFSPGQLLARIRAVMRRSTAAIQQGAAENTLTVADLVLDGGRRQVLRNGQKVNVTKLEFQLLKELALHPGHVLTYRYINDRVWGYRDQSDGSLIKGHIRNLRKKLGAGPSGAPYIETVHGVGYIFRPDA